MVRVYGFGLVLLGFGAVFLLLTFLLSLVVLVR